MRNDSLSLFCQNAKCRVNLYGGIIENLELRENKDNFVNVALSRHDADFKNDPSCAGAILGPCAGRIAKGALDIGNAVCHLDLNDGNNHIHGGSHGLMYTTFRLVGQAISATSSTLVMEAELPDGLDGYPGNRTFSVSYTLSDVIDGTAALQIDLSAHSDKDTFIDMSSHSYWNLNGTFSDFSGLDQYLMIGADRVLYNDKEHIPQKLLPTADSAFDFRKSTLIRDRFDNYSTDSQLQNAHGYNNAFILNRHGQTVPAAVLFSSDRKRKMSLFTDQPAVVFYSGGYLDRNSCAIALEASGWPDSPHIEGAPSQILKAGTPYHRYIKYLFQ